MLRKYGLWIAGVLAMLLAGCGGSEYRFGNNRTLPNLSGKWNVSATSNATSQQYAGTANLAQTNMALQGSFALLFTYCADSATATGLLDPNTTFTPTSLTSYGVTITLQESVGSNSGPQSAILKGSASADGTHMSGTYTVPAGSCTTGDNGVWTANKAD